MAEFRRVGVGPRHLLPGLLVLVAACAPPPTAAQLSASAASVSASWLAGLPTVHAPAASTSAAGSSAPAAPPTRSGTPTTGGPDGPAPSPAATVVLVLSVAWGASCGFDKTLVPQRVVYSDGTVLDPDQPGLSCTPIPQVIASRIDPVWLRSRLDGYVGSPDAQVDLSAATGGRVSSEGPYTTLTYTDRAGGIHRVHATELDSTTATYSDAAEHGRAALRALLADLTAHLSTPARWLPSQLEIVNAGPAGAGQRVLTWPGTPPAAVVSVARGRTGNCTVIDGPTVAGVLAAGRDTTAAWRVAGAARELAVGVVLPGFPICRNQR